MAITADNLRTKFPEFSALTDAEIQPSIDEAVLTVEVDTDSTVYDLCLLYLSAHLLSPSFGGESVSSGPVVARTDGRVSVQFADRGSTYAATGPHSSTQYGQRYDYLVRSQGREILVV